MQIVEMERERVRWDEEERKREEAEAKAAGSFWLRAICGVANAPKIVPRRDGPSF